MTADYDELYHPEFAPSAKEKTMVDDIPDFEPLSNHYTADSLEALFDGDEDVVELVAVEVV